MLNGNSVGLAQALFDEAVENGCTLGEIMSAIGVALGAMVSGYPDTEMDKAEVEDRMLAEVRRAMVHAIIVPRETGDVPRGTIQIACKVNH